MASIQAGGRGRRGGIVGINVTPMVDVVLVLLVIMMVSATYIVSQSLHVDLPKSSTSDESVPTVATVTITKDHQHYFNDEKIAVADLAPRIHGAHEKSPDVSLVISADQETLHGDVVHVIDLAKVEGISKLAIQVERSQ